MKRPANVRRALTDAKGIAAGLPDLLVEARRIATTVLAGWHGRRVSGRGIKVLRTQYPSTEFTDFDPVSGTGAPDIIDNG